MTTASLCDVSALGNEESSWDRSTLSVVLLEKLHVRDMGLLGRLESRKGS